MFYHVLKKRHAMKKNTLLLLLIVGFMTNTFSQATASATVTATIIAPIAIVNAVDMNFGNIAVQAGGAGSSGTVVIAPAGTRTGTAGVTLPSTTGTFTAASFNIGGASAYTYVITIPSTGYVITKAATLETMTVSAFTSTPSSTGILTGGAETLNIGATLNVAAGQAPGVYSNTTGFDITVNYN
jgi:hypothetical protein|tara:strand:+ start:402 stop:953 length:552 start_codon:yes stop_codon:yes gene_type:complete